jgi:hypothetical protein
MAGLPRTAALVEVTSLLRRLARSRWPLWICPSSQRATVQNFTSNFLQVGEVVFPSGRLIGPFMVSRKRVTEQVQSPPANEILGVPGIVA